MKEIMICSNCGKECLMASIKPRGRESVVVSHCCHSSCNSKDNWIDLILDKINEEPTNFFHRKDIEIEYFIGCEWVRCDKDLNHRKTIVKYLIEGCKYRYRIQEKKPIQITRDIIKKYKLPVTQEIYEIPKEEQTGCCGIFKEKFVLDGHEVIID